MICLVNRKRLTKFNTRPQTYKGLSIGNIIQIPVDQAEELNYNLVIITGFSVRYQVIYWRGRCKNGGLLLSGSLIKDVLEL